MAKLVEKVVAKQGTMAEKVLKLMLDTLVQRREAVRNDKPCPEIEFELLASSEFDTNDKPCLLLDVVERGSQSHSYSLRYTRRSSNILILSIGKFLPENRLFHVASSILAMIARGNDWQDGGKKESRCHTEAYGPTRQRENSRSRRRRGRNEARNQRLTDCRAYSGRGGW